jgi:heat-inducible transcriptional repressor
VKKISDSRQAPVSELNERSREIFRLIVSNYVRTGDPVGSRTLAKQMEGALSPASIRNVMVDLQDVGLLYAPHTSSGRLPTEAGLRLFVDGLLELGPLTKEDRARIESSCHASGRSSTEIFEEATEMLSGLSHCASLVMAPKTERPLKHVEFVHLGGTRALVIMVADNSLVENRIIEIPLGMMPSTLIEAGNYLNARLVGRTLNEARGEIIEEIREHKTQLDDLSARVVGAGVATLGNAAGEPHLIVRGQSKLLEDVTVIADLERIRALLETLETRESLTGLLQAAEDAEGVQIFIGSENSLFSLSGCSMIVKPFDNDKQQIIGAIGVVGPTRINYARIIPMVDYTAQLVGRLLA